MSPAPEVTAASTFATAAAAKVPSREAETEDLDAENEVAEHAATILTVMVFASVGVASAAAPTTIDAVPTERAATVISSSAAPAVTTTFPLVIV